jgi:exopolysaccharide biosynthesis predicted pyruvyltransferase EpsI
VAARRIDRLAAHRAIPSTLGGKNKKSGEHGLIPQTLNRDDMQSLNAQLSKRIDETLAPLIAGRSERICIIDPPGYANVGDSAFLLGELAFLRRHLLFDSLDGKVSALHEAWTKGTTNARLASSVDEVAGLVHEFR